MLNLFFFFFFFLNLQWTTIKLWRKGLFVVRNFSFFFFFFSSHTLTCKKTTKSHTVPCVKFENIYTVHHLYKNNCSPVNWVCRIRQLHLCQGANLPHPIIFLDMTLNQLMVWLQSRNSGEYRVLLCCHYSQVHFDLEW